MKILGVVKGSVEFKGVHGLLLGRVESKKE